jgi:riboflavin-specific deaminase-like protein
VKIFSNLAISLDGKIIDRKTPSKMLGTIHDKRRMSELRMEADVIVCGASTLRDNPHSYKVPLKDIPKTKRKNFRAAANAIVTASGKLDSNMPFWSDPSVVRFVFTTEEGFRPALDASLERAFVVSCGKKGEVDLKEVLLRLKKSNLKNVLVEGGGELMASFLRENLLQEIFITVTPWILGGRENPTLVGGAESLVPWRKLKLIKMHRVQSEIFAQYQVVGAKRV